MSLSRRKSREQDFPLSTHRFDLQTQVDDSKFIYVIPRSTSNETLETRLCANWNGMLKLIDIETASDNDALYNVPSCIYSINIVTHLTLVSFIMSDINGLPSGLTSLTLTSCVLTPTASVPSSTRSYHGVEAGDAIISISNSVDWTNLFNKFGSLISLSLSSNSLTGSLPSQFPSRIESLILSNNKFTGSVPTTMFVNMAGISSPSFTIDLSENDFTGPFPSFNLTGSTVLQTLFVDYSSSFKGPLPSTPFANLQVLYDFQLLADFNQFTGEMPETFFQGIGMPYRFSATFSNSGLEGQLPEGLFSTLSQYGTAPPISGPTQEQSLAPVLASLNTNYSSLSVFSFKASRNNLTGSIPNALFSGIAAASIFRVELDSNTNLGGPLPPDLFNLLAPGPSNASSLGSLVSVFSFSAQECDLTGPLPDSPFTAVGKATSFTFWLDGNSISGTLPNTFASGICPSLVANDNSASVAISMFEHQLTGTIPSNFFSCLVAPSSTATNSLYTFTFLLSRSVLESRVGLTGQIPDDLFAQVKSKLKITIGLENNQLSGTLPQNILPAMSGAVLAQIVLSFANNAITGSISNAWTTIPWYSLTLSNNALVGDLPQAIFSYLISGLAKVDVSNNPSLGGSLPMLQGSGGAVLEIYLTNTSIDVCSVTTSSPSYTLPARVTDCNLDGTNVCGVTDHCYQVYTKCAPGCSPIPVSGCSPATKPTPDFICVGTVWTAPTSITVPTLTISETTIINGNLSTSSIIYSGSIGTLIVNGCTTNLSLIQVVIGPETVGAIKAPIALISSYANCSGSNFANVNVEASVKGSSCKRVTAKKLISDDGTTLSAFFTISNSKCNTWWIILVSVVCGLIVLAAIVFAIIAIKVPSVRHAIRPYSKAKKNRAALKAAEMS